MLFKLLFYSSQAKGPRALHLVAPGPQPTISASLKWLLMLNPTRSLPSPNCCVCWKSKVLWLALMLWDAKRRLPVRSLTRAGHSAQFPPGEATQAARSASEGITCVDYFLPDSTCLASVPCLRFGLPQPVSSLALWAANCRPLVGIGAECPGRRLYFAGEGQPAAFERRYCRDDERVDRTRPRGNRARRPLHGGARAWPPGTTQLHGSI